MSNRRQQADELCAISDEIAATHPILSLRLGIIAIRIRNGYDGEPKQERITHCQQRYVKPVKTVKAFTYYKIKAANDEDATPPQQ